MKINQLIWLISHQLQVLFFCENQEGREVQPGNTNGAIAVSDAIAPKER
jgi:hypothetical protein